MIRFIPDSLVEAVLRPLTMAAPNSGIYVEIMAPDLRFIFILCAGLIVGLSTFRRQSVGCTAIVPLTIFVAVAFSLWVATSGNGRYFIPGLILVGPLLVGWLYRANLSRSMKLTLCGLMLAVQGWAVWQTAPWDAWSQTAWVAPTGFQVSLDERAKTEPATYVTLKVPTYSIIAPQFSHQARWINLDTFQGKKQTSDEEKIHSLLSNSLNIRLVTPAEYPQAQLGVDAALVSAFNGRLQTEGLSIAKASDCQIFLSTSIRPRVPIRLIREHDVVELGPVGFWICSLKYDASAARPSAKVPELVASLIAQIEQSCPKFFPLGQGQNIVLQDITIINYPSSDMKLYAHNTGDVSYLYYRASGLVQIASKGILRKDTKAWCENIQGRSGALWK